MTTETETQADNQQERSEDYFRVLDWIDLEQRGNVKATFSVEIINLGLIIEGFAFGRSSSGLEFVICPQRKQADAKIPIIRFSSPAYARWFLDTVLEVVRVFLDQR